MQQISAEKINFTSPMKRGFLFIWLLLSGMAGPWGQAFYGLRAQAGGGEPIEVLHADRMILSKKYPDLKLLDGHVRLKHKNAVLSCDKALLDTRKNFAEAIGHVILNQGDTLKLYADVIRYDGSKDFALAMGHVRMYDPTMQLQTDTLFYDKRRETAFYRSGGIIRDSINTLQSKVGKYFVKQNRYEFVHNVKVINPEYTILSTHLDYNTQQQVTRFFGPTKIIGDNSWVYAERGQYNSRDNTAWFTQKAFVHDRNKWTVADSIYSDRNARYYAASGHVRMKDSLRKVLIMAGYAQLLQGGDSVVLEQKPVIINYDRDTFYLAARRIYFARRDSTRRMYAFPQVAFYRKDFSGRADSLYQSNTTGRIELYKNPVLWSNESQITGDRIFIVNDSATNRVDSLLMPHGVFIAQKEEGGYNQIKGKSLKGKFVEGRLRHIDIRGNTETVYYLKDDQGRLSGIDRSVCSRIHIDLDTAGQATKIVLYDNPKGTTYPPGRMPKAEKFLPGFKWLGDKRIQSPDELLQGAPLDFNPPVLKPVYREEEDRKAVPVKLPASFLKKL